MDPFLLRIVISVLVFVAAFLLVSFGFEHARQGLRRVEGWFERILVQQLLIEVSPRTAMVLAGAAILGAGLVVALILEHAGWFFIGAAAGALVPYVVVRHMELKRRERLERQLVDGITTLSSGVRGGLNLVQAVEMLVQNSLAPLQQEFAQLLREYQMGLDLNQAMRNAANRIGSSHYRLVFSALEMHRRRGGDTGQSLDRIAESIREIQRLEGKLDAVTASGRFQAFAIAVMPMVLLGVLYLINPDDVRVLFTVPIGRAVMLIAVGLIVVAFVWIRKIMDVDI